MLPSNEDVSTNDDSNKSVKGGGARFFSIFSDFYQDYKAFLQ